MRNWPGCWLVRCRIAAIGLAGALAGCASSEGGLQSLKLTLASQRERWSAGNNLGRPSRRRGISLGLADGAAGTTEGPVRGAQSRHARVQPGTEQVRYLSRREDPIATRIPENLCDFIDFFVQQPGRALILANDLLQPRLLRPVGDHPPPFAMNSTSALGGPRRCPLSRRSRRARAGTTGRRLCLGRAGQRNLVPADPRPDQDARPDWLDGRICCHDSPSTFLARRESPR